MVVYPKVAEKNTLVKWFVSTVSSLVGYSSSTPMESGKKNFDPLSKEELARICLQFYLKSFTYTLLPDGEYHKGFKVDTIVFEIVHVYFVMHKPQVDGCKWEISLMKPVSVTL